MFGAADYFSGIAVMIDTYKNHKEHQKQKHSHPLVAVMVNNGSISYKHDRDGVPAIVGWCEAKVRQVAYETHLSIRYENEELHIKTDISGDRQWKHCARLRRLHLPRSGYFGLSASTGDLSDNHDVLSLKVYELDTESPDENRPSVPVVSYEGPVTLEHERKSIWGIFFLSFFGLLGTIFLSSICYIYWQDRKDQQAKQKRMY